MLSKDKRVRSAGDYKRIYSKGSFFSSRFFTVNYMTNRTQKTRIGFVVSKKATKKATERNKIKRQFRETARALYEEAPKGYDIVINIKKEALGIGHKELLAEIQNSFQRIGKNEKNNLRRH